MAYNKQNFESGGKLYASQLNNMDEQIAKNAEHDHNDDYVKNTELAEVGQTIVVKAVDDNGKPTEWKSADYQPRTHWEEKDTTVIIPEQEYTFGDMGFGINMTMFSAVLPCVVGEVYNVYFDDTLYVCRAIQTLFMGGSYVCIGNEALIGGINSGEPFAIGIGGSMVVIAVADDESTHKVKVTQSTIQALDSRYYANNFDIHLSGNETDGWTIDKTADEIMRAYNGGMRLSVKHDTVITNSLEYLCEYAYSPVHVATATYDTGRLVEFSFVTPTEQYNGFTTCKIVILITATVVTLESVEVLNSTSAAAVYNGEYEEVQ